NLLDLLSGELFRRHAGRTACLAEETIQASRRHNPEQEEFVIAILKSVPCIFGNEDSSTLLKRATYIVQYDRSTTFQHVERLVHLEVSMDRNTAPDHHLLSSRCKILRAGSRAHLDEDVSVVAKMNEMFAFGGAKHVSLPCCLEILDDALRQHLAYAESSSGEE